MTRLFPFGIGAAMAISVAVLLRPAQAATPTIDQLVDDAFCKGTPQKRADYIVHHPDFSAVKCGQASSKSIVAAAKPAQSNDIAKTSTPPQTLPNGDTFVPTYFLRNDWADLGLLGTGCFFKGVGVSADKAKGAAVSFTRDYAANNRIWAAQAMAGAVFSDCHFIPPGSGESGFVEKSVAVYAQINSDYNSNATFAKKNNVDARTVGLSGEITYLNGGLDYNVLRVTPNVVFDNIKNTTSGAVMIQYVPVWLSIPWLWSDWQIYPNVYFQFDPTLDLQYASAMEHSQPLQFSGKDQSLRLGPELTFILQPFGSSKTTSSPLSNIGISETFHPWYETYNGRGSYWWDNSIFYNITSDGNFAVKFSYQRGLDENSGTMTNQYIASLTGKY